MSALQEKKSTQTSVSVFAERIEKAKNTLFEVEQIEIVDCFLDGHGSYDSKLVPFKKNLYDKQNFLLQLVRVMSVPRGYKMLVKNETPNQKISSRVRF